MEFYGPIPSYMHERMSPSVAPEDVLKSYGEKKPSLYTQQLQLLFIQCLEISS